MLVAWASPRTPIQRRFAASAVGAESSESTVSPRNRTCAIDESAGQTDTLRPLFIRAPAGRSGAPDQWRAVIERDERRLVPSD
jgi:hypothetical protein